MRTLIAALAMVASTGATANEFCEEVAKRAKAIMFLTQEYSNHEITSMFPDDDRMGRFLVGKAFEADYPTGNHREQILFEARMRALCLNASREVGL